MKSATQLPFGTRQLFGEHTHQGPQKIRTTGEYYTGNLTLFAPGLTSLVLRLPCRARKDRTFIARAHWKKSDGNGYSATFRTDKEVGFLLMATDFIARNAELLSISRKPWSRKGRSFFMRVSAWRANGGERNLRRLRDLCSHENLESRPRGVS